MHRPRHAAFQDSGLDEGAIDELLAGVRFPAILWACRLGAVVVQIFVNGLIAGVAIALTAIALQIVYLPTRILYFGLAGLYSLAPFIYVASRGDLGDAGAVVCTVLVIVGLALAIERFNHAPLARKHASSGAHFLSSLGISIVLINIAATVWGAGTRRVSNALEPIVEVGGIIFARSQLITATTSTLLIVTFLVVLSRTRLGLRLRALADNPTQFGLYGYDVGAHRLAAFGLSGFFVVASSLLTAQEFGFDAFDGLDAILFALVAIVVGGRLSFVGPIVGAMILGLVQVGVSWCFSERWAEAFTFLVLAIFLLAKPEGLLGKKARVEAAA